MASDPGKLLSFDDAQRLAGAPVFASMAKPVGSACNLDCAYCYYLGKSYRGEGPVQRMIDRTLEEYVRQYIGSNAAGVVSFCWHGGEPLLAGIDFYRRALDYQRKYADGRQIENTIQTNGTLVDGEWCDFFRRNGFLVGVSIDGPRDIHDAYRYDRAGRGSFDRVVRAIGMMSAGGVEFNTLSTVNNLSEGRGAEVYDFLKSLGSRFMQFLPVVEHTIVPAGGEPGKKSRPVVVPPGTEGSGPAPWSVSAEGFGRFMTDIFDRWVARDVGRYFVPMFDAVLAGYVGLTPALCTLAETCGRAVAVERDGDVFACDHFVFPEHRLGNVAEGDMSGMVRCAGQVRFGLDKRNALPGQCRRCRWLFVCRGECPKHRFATTDDGEGGLNSLCEGYRLFFAHTDPAMKYMAGELAAGRSPANVMNTVKPTDR